MEREEAIRLLKSKIKNKNLIKHSLAVEACMRKLARYFGEDEEMWGLCGLLHDLDYEDAKLNPEIHGYKTAEYLKGKVPEVVIDAIISHPGHKERETKMAKALYCVDPLTGLIVACALILPEKKLEKIDKKFVLNRFKEKRFAAGANREQIKECEKLGFSLEEFIEICLSAMKSISDQLGL
ncbi:MAG TPA: HDIG domain-containing protein [Firmicutes bacterium]|nr:MAG: phosphohydrolase [Candidatus Omnitrophota bacterium]HDD64902.1 HDIG domain-containing protein [Bacillota bacterium]